MRKIVALTAATAVALALSGCKKEEAAPAAAETTEAAAPAADASAAPSADASAAASDASGHTDNNAGHN